VLKSPSIEDFAKSYREVEKVLMVRGGGNKASHYLEVAIFAEGGRKGIIWLPEGHGGWGWHQFVGELCQLVPFQAKSELQGSVENSSAVKQVGAGAKASSSRRSFAEVVQATISSPANSSGLKKPILGLLDLFPVAACFEWEKRGENLRLAEDCSKMEKNMKRLEAGSAESSGSMKKVKKMKGTLVNHSQKKILEFA
jgi:hypothetical protein